MAYGISTGNAATAAEYGSRPAAPFAVDISKGEVHGDVSAQWAMRPEDQKFDTLSDLYAYSRAAWDGRRNIDLTSAELTATHPALDFAPVNPDDTDMTEAQVHAEMKARMSRLNLTAVVREGGDTARHVELAPTNWAFLQLCDYANVGKSEVKKYPTKIACDMVNWQIRYGSRSEDVRVWSDDVQAHAIQSPNYGRIADHEVIASVMTIAGDGKGEDPRFHWKAPGRLIDGMRRYDPEALGPKADRTFYGSDRDCFMFLVDDRRPIVVGKTRDGNDDLMFRGFYVQNSMVGARSLKVASFYLRGVCMNRNLWGVEGFNEIMVRHTRGAPERWLQEAKPALESFANGSDAKLIEGVKAAKAKLVVEKEESGLKFLRDMAFSDTAARQIIKRAEDEEGHKPRSVWDFGQAITAFARDARNSDARLDIEIKAKKVFDRVK